MTGRMLAALERVIIEERPDLVLVPGDTNSTLAGALAAAKLHVPVAHLEAGLPPLHPALPGQINPGLTGPVRAPLLCPPATPPHNPRWRGHRAGVPDLGDLLAHAAPLS